ncbi:hypothetical protein EVAR_101913_1 [Eumeta japonica]|uniref:Uncharacterized protein n=1 Tax=Eumeta variegata TaxID=151549 RepID=A0A4C1TST8_EUMVA|nr:hypothetical protein EVAR_101913_1 [Eumeta japonica]
MSRRDIEQSHMIDLKKILEEEGLDCIRVMVDVAESESSLGDEQVIVDEQEQLKEELREEEQLHVEEVIEEPVPYLFPTPSLRKLLPENIREIEKFNRIHVLPEEFNFSIDPSAIPRIYGTPKQSYIDKLAELVGCTAYKSSLAEYWFLDTLADLLRRAQDDYMDRCSFPSCVDRVVLRVDEGNTALRRRQQGEDAEEIQGSVFRFDQE